MAGVWKHPKLGQFKFNGLQSWGAVVNLPAFKKFSYDTGYSNARRSRGKHVLAFEAADENDKPSAEQVALALRLVENQGALVDAIARAFWEEFTGEGPTTGMWWHGKLDDIADEVVGEHVPQLKGPDDVRALLLVESVAVRKDAPGYPRPVLDISFHAPFEEEHGVSVLSDGETVLGSGYMLDAELYKPHKASKPKRDAASKHATKRRPDVEAAVIKALSEVIKPLRRKGRRP